MRKIFIFLSMFFLYLPSMVYAGDVPEALLNDDDAMVFFAEVEENDGNDIILVQKKNVKGDFSNNSKIKYSKYCNMGGFEIKDKVMYLCGAFKNGEVYLWEISNDDPKTLEIAAKDDMSRRLQEYLNDGKFFVNQDFKDIQDDKDINEVPEKKESMLNFFLGMIFTIIVVLFVIDKIKNKKVIRKNKR